MPKKESEKDSSNVKEELKDFNIKINEFGEITTNLEIEKLNEFLNDNVEDKKIKDSEEDL